MSHNNWMSFTLTSSFSSRCGMLKMSMVTMISFGTVPDSNRMSHTKYVQAHIRTIDIIYIYICSLIALIITVNSRRSCPFVIPIWKYIQFNLPSLLSNRTFYDGTLCFKFNQGLQQFRHSLHFRFVFLLGLIYSCTIFIG